MFEDWAVTFNCGGEEKVGAAISSITSEKEEERKMGIHVCCHCGHEMGAEEFQDAIQGGCDNCGYDPSDPKDGENTEYVNIDQGDPQFEYMADFEIGTFSLRDWNKINEIANANRDNFNKIRLEVAGNKEIDHMKPKQLRKLLVFLQFAKDQLDDANTGICQENELHKANLEGFSSRLKDLGEALRVAGSERVSLETKVRDLTARNNELEKYNGRNNLVVSQATEIFGKLSRMVTPYDSPIESEETRRIRDLESQLISAKATNISEARSFVFRELRERQLFALFMNQQISTEQLSLILGKDMVSCFGDWARVQYQEHQQFHAQTMAAILDWNKLNDESEVTKEILAAYLDSTRMEVSHSEREMILAMRKKELGFSSILPLSEEEIAAVTKLRSDKVFKSHFQQLISHGADAVNRIREQEKMEQSF